MKERPSILVVLESIDIDDSSGTKGRLALIQNLIEIGYQLKILHYTRRDVSLNGIETISIREKKMSLNYVLSRLRRLINRYFKKDLFKWKENSGFSFGFKNDSASMASAIRSNYNGEDMILTMSKGSSFRPHHAMLQLPQLQKKWVAYVHDPYPFHLYPKPYDWIEPGHQKREDFFKQVSEKAKVSVFPSKLLLEWMGGFFPNFNNTGVVIPHQIVTNSDLSSNDWPEFFNPEKFNLLHSGNLMKPRNPKGLIEGIKKFLDHRPEAKEDTKLLLIGKADYFKDYLKECQTKNKWLYASLGYLPFQLVQNLQKQCMVNIIIEAKSEISPFLPGKFPHCVVSDKPILVLGPERSEVRRILGSEYPYQSEIDDIEKISADLTKLYDQWKADKPSFRLNRPDLLSYLGTEYLTEGMSRVEQLLNLGNKT